MSIGPLPYGSADPSIQIEVPLTSEPTLLQMGNAGSGGQTGAVDFSATLGCKSDGSSYLRYRNMAGLVGSGLESAGQMSFEVQAAWACVDRASAGSIGYTAAGVEFTVAMGPAGTTVSNSFVGSRRSTGTNSDIQALIGNNAASINSVYGDADTCKLHTIGKGDFIRHSLSWGPAFEMPFTSGGTFIPRVGDVLTGQTSTNTATITAIRVTSGTWAAGTAAGNFIYRTQSGPFTAAELLDIGANANVATATSNGAAVLFMVQIIDGVPMLWDTRADDMLEPSNDLWIAALSATGFTANHYIRNLTISNEEITYGTAKRPMFWGTSQSRSPMMGINAVNGPNPSFYIANPDVVDNTPVYNYLRQAAANNEFIDPAACVVNRWPGYYVSDTTGSTLASTRAEMLSYNPTDVFAIYGTNDSIAGTLPVDFESSLDGHIAAITGYSTVTKMVQVNVRSFIGDTADDSVQSRENRGVVNGIMATKAIDTIDAYTLDGAESPAAFTYLGQFGGGAGLNLDLHIAANGGWLEGVGYYDLSPLASLSAPTLTNPYSDLFNNTGDSGTVALGTNVTGETAIFVDGLPDGATYNNNTGLITYNLTHNGQSRITVKPENSIGETLPNPMFTWYVGAQAEMFNNLEQIGSNGTMFTYKQDSLTLAEMNDAFFSNQYAASVLSTGDSLMIAGSDGTKMVNVTVVKQTRAVTLSTGLTIA